MEAKEFSAGRAGFEDRDCAVLGCSPDPIERHQKFIAKHGLDVTLLSNPGTEVMAKYGAYGEKVFYGVKKIGVIRSTVLIDPAGKVAWRWKSVKTKGHAGKVLEKLDALLEG